MNLFADIRTLVLDAGRNDGRRRRRLPEGLAFANVTVEPPRDAAHGDMATNAAMVLAKPAGMKPRDIAETLAAKLMAQDPRIDQRRSGRTGFSEPAAAAGGLAGRGGGCSACEAPIWPVGDGAGAQVNVEYVSANPTGPLHVGHTRGAVFGDALASLLDFAGHDVTREYYINDGGAQVDVLARSVYLRYLEAHGPRGRLRGRHLSRRLSDPGGRGAGERQVGDAWVDQPEAVWLAEIRDYATDAMMDLIREDLAALGREDGCVLSAKNRCMAPA